MIDNEIIDILAREALKRVSASLAEIKAKIDFLALENEKLRNSTKEATQSIEQGLLLEALAAAKMEMSSSNIERSGYIQNRGSYATLDDIREFVDPILSKYGLSFRVEPIEKNNEDYLTAYLGHKSGQWYSSTCKIKPDYNKSSDALQAYGKALTSMKRYVYGAYFMLHTGGEKE